MTDYKLIILQSTQRVIYMKKQLIYTTISGIIITAILFSSAKASTTSTATNPQATDIIIQGKSFVFKSNPQTRFMIRGVTYQPEQNVDPISDNNYSTIEKLVGTSDKPGLWKQLNINAIRVYQVDPSQSHKNIMDFLARNGIYVLVGTSNTSIGIDTYNPKYTTAYKNRIKDIINAFYQYPNVLGFNIGNEVEYPSNKNTLENEKNGAAAIKSAIRDAQQYIQSLIQNGQLDHQIPVGTAMLDNPNPPSGQVGTPMIAQYLACDSNDNGNNVRADYIGINNSRFVSPNGNLNAYDELKRLDRYYKVSI